MEPFGKFLIRKLSDLGSAIYRKLIFPFVKMGIERSTGSIIGKGSYLYKGTKLFGKDFIGDKVELANVSVGKSTYIGHGSLINNTRIGSYTCIAGLETAIGRHPVKGENISVHPAFYSSTAQYGYTYEKETSFEEVKYTDPESNYNVVIGNDVWIGRGVMVTDGVTIGDGAVVGAASLVTSDIEPYAMYAGSPARKIGTRFDDDKIAKLLDMKWWEKDEAWIREHADTFKHPEEFFE